MSNDIVAVDTAQKLSIVDLGEHSRERIKDLRKGKGKLLSKVEDAVAGLTDGGVIDPSAHVVVLVVREEPWSLFKS